MAPVARPVKEVDRSNKPPLKVRVVRRFYRTGAASNKRSLEIVFHDSGRITGIVKSLNLELLDNRFVQDVIGKVTEIHNPQEKEFSGKRLASLKFGRQVSATLWGNYVDEILTFEGNLKAGPPVLILQLCRAEVYRVFSYIMDPLILTIRNVDSLYTVTEESEFWICAIIVNFIGNWWYHGCSVCNAEMVEQYLNVVFARKPTKIVQDDKKEDKWVVILLNYDTEIG
ncbi:hypothetical protein CASFOL_001576 [Castilleja foliolosa]|uniref:Uncharacterized protein n=1 Tax=Castilleja foliolosa TaxID=1961234 RepID=A0ABD3EK14_9LAMI